MEVRVSPFSQDGGLLPSSKNGVPHLVPIVGSGVLPSSPEGGTSIQSLWEGYPHPVLGSTPIQLWE